MDGSEILARPMETASLPISAGQHVGLKPRTLSLEFIESDLLLKANNL
jgi:hypothetical protein